MLVDSETRAVDSVLIGERFISAMPLEEDEIFMCPALLFYVSNFCRFANGARCHDIDQVLLHGAVF